MQTGTRKGENSLQSDGQDLGKTKIQMKDPLPPLDQKNM